MAGGNLPFGLAPSGSLTSYTPTLRERATDWVRRTLFSDDREGQGRATKVMDVASVTPFGFGLDVYDAGREAGLGNYGTAGLMLGMAGAPGPSNRVAEAVDRVRQKFPSLKLDVSVSPNNMTLSRIVVPESERGNGLGTTIMQELTAIADQNSLPLALTPSPDFGGSVSRLKEFYGRFGFKPNKGRNKDFSVSESYIRQPRKLEQP